MSRTLVRAYACGCQDVRIASGGVTLTGRQWCKTWPHDPDAVAPRSMDHDHEKRLEMAVREIAERRGPHIEGSATFWCVEPGELWAELLRLYPGRRYG